MTTFERLLLKLLWQIASILGRSKFEPTNLPRLYDEIQAYSAPPEKWEEEPEDSSEGQPKPKLSGAERLLPEPECHLHMYGKGIYLIIDNLPELEIAGCDSLVLDVINAKGHHRLVLPIDKINNGRITLAVVPFAVRMKEEEEDG